ncbi:Regulator of cytoskeleton and endocytosis [Candida albicans]|nr:Regulator of cytoskeleton and endocytosis [Candida albicans]
MSWGGFKKAINRAGASVIVKDVDKTMDKDFDVEERRYKTLKTAGTNLQKAAKGYLDNIRAITNSQVTIAEIIYNLYEESKQGQSLYSNVGTYYMQSVKEFDEETVKQIDGPYRETVLDPIGKFSNYFSEIDEAIKKRAHKKIDYEQCKAKVRRLVDKPAKDAAKLPRAEKELSMAKEIYDELNDQLKAELPQLIALRVPFYDPSFEALVKIQLRFCTEGYSRLAQIQQYLDPASRDEYANGLLDGKIDDMLAQMQGLSITSLGKKTQRSFTKYGATVYTGNTKASVVVYTIAIANSVYALGGQDTFGEFGGGGFSCTLVMEVFMELTYFMGVVTIDRKVDLDGATAISWWKYKLLRVRSNSNLVIPLGVLLMIGVLSHWTVVMPEKTAVIITQSNTYIYYVEYLLLVVFIVAVVALVVPAKTQPVEFAEEKSYNTIVMDTSSDILRITTNPKTSSIVTTLLDHRVLYWTPQGNSEPIPIPCRMWPVNHVGLNDDGSMVVLVSTRQGVIQGVGYYCGEHCQQQHEEQKARGGAPETVWDISG